MKHESQIIKDEHDESLNAKKVSIVGGSVGNATVTLVSTPTLFAVVNTANSGQASVVLDSSVANIGFASVNVVNTTLAVIGNATGGLADSLPPVKVGGRYNSTLPTYSDGQRTEVQTSTRGAILTQLVGVNSNSGANVFTTSGDNQAFSNGLSVNSQNVIFNGSNWDRMKTANNANATTGTGVLAAGNMVYDGTNWRRMIGGTDGRFEGNVTINNPVSIAGNVTLSDPKTYIGLTTTTLGTSVANIGFATVFQASSARTITGNLTLSDSKTFIGLVTAWARNAGTTKTLSSIPVVLSTASIQTLATPATNLTMYVTNVVLNSDATVRVSIKSGVTYLTGNASIGIVLNPGGGWVETGAPDSPTYIGCPSGPLIVEKFDMTGTKANVGGKLVFFSE